MIEQYWVDEQVDVFGHQNPVKLVLPPNLVKLVMTRVQNVMEMMSRISVEPGW
jgi:hypothetical protein